LGRGRLSDDLSIIESWEVIFRQQPKVEGLNHFGNRIVFDGNGHFFLALGKRLQFGSAQDLSNTLGTMFRLNLSGSIPEDIPFFRRDGEHEIWSYGHRNIEATIRHLVAGQVWVTGMSPLGGDELNSVVIASIHNRPIVSWASIMTVPRFPNPPEFPRMSVISCLKFDMRCGGDREYAMISTISFILSGHIDERQMNRTISGVSSRSSRGNQAVCFQFIGSDSVST
jgi:hypothetical protein